MLRSSPGVGGEVGDEAVVGAADHQREAPTRDGDRLIVGDAPLPRVDGDRDPSLLVPTQEVGSFKINECGGAEVVSGYAQIRSYLVATTRVSRF